VAWRVHLVRSGGVPELSLFGGRFGPLVLRFQNGIETGHLAPAPADWRECDDAALWRYCQAAQPSGMRRALVRTGVEPLGPPAKNP
jgi:hypothetical protein